MPRSRAAQRADLRAKGNSRIKARRHKWHPAGHSGPQCGLLLGLLQVGAGIPGTVRRIWWVSASGVISERKITSWRQRSPEPYCPNGLRRGLMRFQGSFWRRNQHQEGIAASLKICCAENKERPLPSKNADCTTVFKEKGCQHRRKNMCLD